jgi:hypothetical protein
MYEQSEDPGGRTSKHNYSKNLRIGNPLLIVDGIRPFYKSVDRVRSAGEGSF